MNQKGYPKHIKKLKAGFIISILILLSCFSIQTVRAEDDPTTIPYTTLNSTGSNSYGLSLHDGMVFNMSSLTYTGGYCRFFITLYDTEDLYIQIKIDSTEDFPYIISASDLGSPIYQTSPSLPNLPTNLTLIFTNPYGIYWEGESIHNGSSALRMI